MKKISVSAIFCLIGFMASAQFIYKIKADSVLITNDSCNAELNLENSTRNRTGGFLKNRGNGRTQFAYIIDSAWMQNGRLYLHRGDTTFSYSLTPDSLNGKFIWNQDSVSQIAKAWITGNIQIDIPGAGLTYGSTVSFTRSNFGSQVDSISPSVKMARANEYSLLYNTVYETEYGSGSPANTEWNSDGWTNLSNITERPYKELVSALADLGEDVESVIVNAELIMHIISEDRYFKVKFTSWTPADGGGGFTYQRTEIFGMYKNFGLSTNGGIRSITRSIIGGVTISRGGDNVPTNIAIGAGLLKNNTSGFNNIALGNEILTNNTTGLANVGLGNRILSTNTTGSGNIGFGSDILPNNISGGSNIGFGSSLLTSNTTGSNNYVFGQSVLTDNTTGFENVGVGLEVLAFNTTGQENSAIGSYAMHGNNTGNYNTSFGSSALYANVTGSYNIGIGYHADQSYANLNNSIALGREALRYDGNPNTYVQYDNVIAIGNQVAKNTAIQSNDIYIDGLGSGNPALSGNSSAKKIGINLPYNQTWTNNAQLQVRGTSTSTGDALLVENSSPSTLLKVANNGQVAIGTNSFSGTEKLRVNGTVLAEKLRLANVPTYADDTAAGTGGLTAGDVYKTSTGVLMIKL